MIITPFSATIINLNWWRDWARANGKDVPSPNRDYIAALKLLGSRLGKTGAASVVQLGFLFDAHYEIPGVGLMLLDESSMNEHLYFGQASVLHWVSLNNPEVNKKLRSMGILAWWTS